MSVLEAITKLNAIDVALAHLASEADDSNDSDASENIEAARDHILDAVDALRNTLTASEAV